jgi:putative copper resistance protein D
MVSIVAIVASGAFEAWSILQRAPDFSVPYDQLLAGKVGLLLLLVGLAAVNRLALMPRLGNGANLPRLRSMVALEQGLGLAIVFVAITLGATNPHP